MEQEALKLVEVLNGDRANAEKAESRSPKPEMAR